MSRKVKTAKDFEFRMARFSRAAVHFGRMDLQIKLLQWEDREHYLIVIGRGELNRESLKELFHKLTEAIRTNQDCKILVDLQDVTTVMSSSNIDALLDESKVSFVKNTIVFVCPEESRQYFLLIALSTSLTKLGHNVAVFSDAKTATDWLRGSP